MRSNIFADRRPLPGAGRLGIYVDDVYRVIESADGTRVSTDRAFLLFACAVGSHFRELALVGRARRDGTAADYELPGWVRFVELPYYTDLHHGGEVARGFAGTIRQAWRWLGQCDTVWVIEPHPLGLVFAGLARLRRKRVVLGVRNEGFEYFRRRMAGARRMMLVLLWCVARAHRLLARVLPTTTVGSEIAKQYEGGRAPVLPMRVSLVSHDDIVAGTVLRDWSGAVSLLTVSRLAPEKNPLLLTDLMARLEAERPGRYRLTVIGRGELEDAFRDRARALGVDDRIVLRGYLPFGDELLAQYRAAHLFVHVSLTEGLPQVLFEAFASGASVIATDVGSVREAVAGGEAALIVPPRDVTALARAVTTLTDDSELRSALAARGRAIAASSTIEVESERVARFLSDAD